MLCFPKALRRIRIRVVGPDALSRHTATGACRGGTCNPLEVVTTLEDQRICGFEETGLEAPGYERPPFLPEPG